jgi:hypothetical protein
MSISPTRWPARASAAERFTAVVVLPTPPFWLMMAMERMELSVVSCQLSVAIDRRRGGWGNASEFHHHASGGL